MEFPNNNNINNNANPNGDLIVPQAQNDGISTLGWSPDSRFFSAGSWNQEVRVWGVGVNTSLKVSYSLSAPILCSVWTNDGKKILTGGCDYKGIMYDLENQKQIQIAVHEQPIKTINFLEKYNIVATGSWDKKIKFWDGKSSEPKKVLTLPERVYCTEVKDDVMVVATAERHVVFYDIRNLDNPFKTLYSPLKYQTRCLAIFPDKDGFAIGGIEGRVALHHFADNHQNKNFAYKCHREDKNVYAVNQISFNNKYKTFSTCGSDGTFHFWDKEAKQRLKAFTKLPTSISCGLFSPDSNYYLYSASYDWHKGSSGIVNVNNIYLHTVKDEEIKRRRN